MADKELQDHQKAEIDLYKRVDNEKTQTIEYTAAMKKEGVFHGEISDEDEHRIDLVKQST